jgi:glyoxylase-like metal-dependent hydrolase (beta-lactamase superfamily II)
MRLLVFLGVLLGGGAALAWFQVGHVSPTRLTDDVYMLSGLGGNVGVLTAPQGVVVVDTMTLVRQGDAIEDAVRAITSAPIVAILNTHYHFDHTHGNPAFPAGTKVVSTKRTLQHLHDRDAEYWAETPARALLPNDTFDGERKELSLGGKTARSYHFGRGHTDGDMVVLFVEDRVLHTGDLFFNGHYPNIDLEAGGSVRAWPATLDKVLALPFDQVIPGHGPATNRVALQRFRDFMSTVWTETARIKERGSLADAQRLVDLDHFGLSAMWLAPYLNRGFVIRRAWEELAGGPRG